MPEALTIDPTSENANNTPLELMQSGGTITVVEHRYPLPRPDIGWASSVDTEGERVAHRRWQNREIQLTLEVWGASAAGMHAALRALEAKVGKLARSGGTLKREYASGQVIVFDILAVASYEPTFDLAFHNGYVSTVELTLVCKPLGRAPETLVTTQTGSGSPALIWTVPSIAGDVPATGRLEVDNPAAAKQNWVIWGMQAETYRAGANTALLLQSEGSTLASGGSVTVTNAAGPAGASGSGNNTVRAQNLQGSHEPVYYLYNGWVQHVGAYRVYARVHAPAANAGDTFVRLSWAQNLDIATAGVGSGVQNAEVRVSDSAYGGKWMIVDLGQITGPPDEVPTHQVSRWSAALEARAATGGTDQIYFDWVMLVPVSEAWGETIGTSTNDPAINPSRTWLVNQDTPLRQDATTTSVWSDNLYYRGDLFTIPPSQGTAQFIVKVSRGAPISTAGAPPNSDPQRVIDPADSAVDNVTARLYVTPRYLNVPA